MPLISVVTPVYNSEKTIRRCVDSVLSQVFPDFELILIDDGSTDASGRICDEYAASDIRVRVIHQKNRGVSAARNSGIRLSRGEILGFVDSDDEVLPEYLQTMYDTLIGTDADLVMCNYDEILKDGNAVEVRHAFSDKETLSGEEIESVLLKNIFDNRQTSGLFPLWNKLFKKDLIERFDIRLFESMSFGEDLTFVTEYLTKCKRIAFCDRVLYHYVIGPQGLYSGYKKNFVDDVMSNFTLIADRFRPKGAEEKDLLNLSMKYWMYINRHLSLIVRNEKHPNREIKRTLSHHGVRRLFKVIAGISDEEAKKRHIHQSELKVPRLVSQNKIRRGVFVVRYQTDSGFWLRKAVLRLRKIRRGF